MSVLLGNVSVVGLLRCSRYALVVRLGGLADFAVCCRSSDAMMEVDGHVSLSCDRCLSDDLRGGVINAVQSSSACRVVADGCVVRR